jgi:hypothetical protein
MPAMTRLAPISPAISARVESCSLDRRYAVVDVGLAARLRSEHARQFSVNAEEGEQITRDVPNVGELELANLDEQGLVRAGAVVGPGDLLIGKVSPCKGGLVSPEEKLLRAIFGEAAGPVRDTSLRAPPGLAGVVIASRMLGGEDREAGIEIGWERPLEVGDVLLVDGEPVMVAEIRELEADLAWGGGELSEVSVAKAVMARDLIHARSIGPYTLTTQQPTVGREQFGGQLVSREQVERLAVHAPWALWEMWTIKADAPNARTMAYEALAKGQSPDVAPRRETEPASSGDIFSFFEKPRGAPPGEEPALQPEAATLLVAYLQALAFGVDFKKAEVGVAIATSAEIVARSHGAVGAEELRSQKIFGPVKDYECECGKYARMKHRGVVCEDCGVEVIMSRVRRERFGHVELAAPCLHPLFVGEVARLLDRTEAEVRAQDGAALWEELEQLDLVALADGELVDTDPPVDGDAGPRAALAGALVRGERPATALMLATLPVLPPGLRGDDESGAHGLSALYREVLERNAAGEPAELQRAVDRLLVGEDGSIARRIDGLVGKQLFEKAVDYSGVAHLVVDPSLAPGECRVPSEMLRELFRPHAYAILAERGYTATIRSAKLMVEGRQPEALAAVEEASEGHPVLLMAGPKIVCRHVRGWDAPAIAVDAATAEEFDSHTVTLHVPLMDEAALQCEQLADFLKGRRVRAEGWLCRARRGPWLRTVGRAALTGERDALADPVVRLALGRPPEPVDAEERAQWAEQARERRERVRERQIAAAPAVEEAAEEAPNESVLDRKVEELELSVRTAVALDRAGLRTLGELCRMSDADLLGLPNFGRKSLNEIKEILGDMGLSLGMGDASNADE